MIFPSAPGRKLGTGDVLLAGLRMMLGAGLFAALGVATDEAGGWVLLSWGIAALVAACCATSALRLTNEETTLAEVLQTDNTHPKLLKNLAAWSLFCGQIMACCVLALTIATYLTPDSVELTAAGVVVIGVLANRVNWTDLLGTPKQTSGNPISGVHTAKLFDRRVTTHELGVTANRLIAFFVLLVLLLVVIASAMSRQVDLSKLSEGTGASWGIVTAAGLLFFAFAGYNRTADLRSKRPRFSIPWGTVAMIASAATIYILTSLALFASASPVNLASGNDPFVQAAHFGSFNRLSGIIRFCVVIACAGVLLPLLRSVSMSVAAVFGKSGTRKSSFPLARHSDVVSGVILLVLVLLVSVRAGLTFSAFCALIFGAALCTIALRLPKKPVKPPPEGTLDDRIREFQQLEPLPPSKRRLARRERIAQRTQSRAQIVAEIFVRVAALFGLIGCLILAFSLPPVPMVVAVGVVIVGTATITIVSSATVSSPPFEFSDEYENY